MKVRTTLKLCAAGVALALAATSGSALAQKRVKWKMQSAFGSSLPHLGTSGVRFSKNISEATDGKFEIKFYEPGALVPALECFDAASKGSVESCWTTPGYHTGKLGTSVSFFTTVPFGPGFGEFMAWKIFGGGDKLRNELYAKHGLIAMTNFCIGPETSGWFKNEIKSLDQLKGMKMRFFGLGAQVMQKLGVSTQLLAGGDIFPALELGTIDATEFSMPAIDLDLGFYQVAKHYYFPGWHQQSTLFDLMMNKEKWDALSDTQKAQIEVTCGDNIREGLAEGEAIQGKALAELKSKGVTIHKWSPEILDTLHKAWDETAMELAAEDPNFKKAWDSLQAFRTEYAEWRKIGYLN